MLGGWSHSQEADERVHVYESFGLSLSVRGAEANPMKTRGPGLTRCVLIKMIANTNTGTWETAAAWIELNM